MAPNPREEMLVTTALWEAVEWMMEWLWDVLVKRPLARRREHRRLRREWEAEAEEREQRERWAAEDRENKKRWAEEDRLRAEARELARLNAPTIEPDEPDDEPYVEPPRVCAECGGSLAGKRINAIFCSDKCKLRNHRATRNAAAKLG